MASPGYTTPRTKKMRTIRPQIKMQTGPLTLSELFEPCWEFSGAFIDIIDISAGGKGATFRTGMSQVSAPWKMSTKAWFDLARSNGDLPALFLRSRSAPFSTNNLKMGSTSSTVGWVSPVQWNPRRINMQWSGV